MRIIKPREAILRKHFKPMWDHRVFKPTVSLLSDLTAMGFRSNLGIEMYLTHNIRELETAASSGELRENIPFSTQTSMYGYQNLRDTVYSENVQSRGSHEVHSK